MVKRGPGYFDSFMSVPNPTTATGLHSKIVYSKDMDQNLLQKYGYGVIRPMPKAFKVLYTNKPGRMVIL